jgi:hypothetical protein
MVLIEDWKQKVKNSFLTDNSVFWDTIGMEHSQTGPSVKQERIMTFTAVIKADKEEMLFIAIKRTYKERRSSFENSNDQTEYVANGLSTFL